MERLNTKITKIFLKIGPATIKKGHKKNTV